MSRGFDFKTGLPAGGCVLLGGIFGAFLLSKFSNKFIKILFALIMIGAGIKMVI